MNPNKELFYQEYVRRENEVLRAPYDPELEFYAFIQAGDVKQTKELCKQSLINKEGLGILSKNYVQHIKYHFVITTALVARFCIQGGMEVSEAYSISDYYIQKADSMTDAKAVSDLHTVMCLDYAKRMQRLQKEKISSKPIARCIDYIYDHLHTRITVSELADYVSLSETYLSRLFKKETGSSISQYIMTQKLKTAQNMLIYSDYTAAQIAMTLAFPSQSYFTEQFHKKTGMTPIQYRTHYFRDTKIGHSLNDGGL